ncbi:hypothetical protein ABBQ32_008886 [Trebouxia sp. C0010 RCD-2024]
MAQNASEGHQDHTRLQTLSQLEQPDIDVAVTLVQASRSRQSVPEGTDTSIHTSQRPGCPELMFLDGLASIEPPALKKRRMRNQHFWRDSTKLSIRERVYVHSAAVQLAIQEGFTS